MKGKKNGAEMEREREMEKKKLKRQKVDEKFDVKTRESISPAGFLSLSHLLALARV